jgi:hypothetical protein
VAGMSNTPEIAKKQFRASGNAVNVHLYARDRFIDKISERQVSNNQLFEDG